MTDLEIINDLERTIRTECDNPADYDGYVENLLHFAESVCDYYNRDEKQIKYLMGRALMRLQ